MARPLTPLVWRLLAGHLALRLCLAWWLPLGVDEAYAIAAAREFSRSFFDHPPLGFWLGVVLASATGIETALVYRLPFLLLGSLTAWTIWQTGRLWSDRAGLIALILFLIAPHMVMGSGLFVLPDAPLNAGCTVAVYLVLRMVMRGQSSLRDWMLAGLALAVAMASKYQAGVLALAVLGYLATSERHRLWLASPGPWLGALIGLVGLLPVILWNLDHDWVSLAFHGGRSGGGVNLPNMARMLAGQAVYLLPPVMVLAALSLYRLRHEEPGRLLLWVAGLPIVFFNLTYLFGTDTLPHWTMPGWMFGLVAAGVWLDRNAGRLPVWRRWIIGFALLVWALVAVYAVHLPTGILTMGESPAPEWDRQVEIIDLSDLGHRLQADGWLAGVNGIAVLNWRIGGQVSTALQGHYPVRVLGEDPRHFQFHRPSAGPLLLILLDHVDAAPAEWVNDNQMRITAQGEVILSRHGTPQIRLRLYRLE